MKNTMKKGFTLIELLVVITIIWILATGATSVYTSQIQKARDATRLNDIDAVKSWVEQFYQDEWQYPDSKNTGTYAFSWVTTYTPKLPSDPKSWQTTTNSSFDYIYTVWQDSNSIDWQDYEISATFENDWNIKNKAKWDGWSDDNRLEIWIDLTTNETDVQWEIANSIAGLTCVNNTASTITCAAESTRLLIRKQ